ncbi:MAG TPA: redoxin domain-containing protein [Candidatus Anaerofilum faecale]|nr:redoxin domain-containing protein [Candidatus Anaerofilum faecale]
MGFTIQNSVSALTVFVQGLLSFFSPCVLPLVPVYLSYLSGGAQQTRHRRRKLLVSTVFFVLGISFAFFVLGMGVSALGQFFSGARVWIARIGGVLLIVMGLIQLFGGGFTRELRLPFRLKNTINPFTALLLGFTFSFAWTPCVGPALASVLLMAGSTGSSALGFAYIGLYTLGFVVPFLLVGIFADAMLGLLSRSKKALVWTTRVGAVLLMLIGVLLLLGWTTGDVAGSGSSSPSASSSAPAPSPEPTATPAPTERPVVAAPDFTLTDQYGNTHTLSDYKGKVVFLNFWADWCGYCVEEMPDIQQLYLDEGENTGDVIILGITNGLSQQEMADFFAEKELTYPTLLDTDGSVFATYGAYSLPTTFMIDVDGNVYGYLPGMMDRETMDSIIAQTKGES